MAKKYLIIQTAFIGDVILATPLVESLKQNDSKNQIDVLVKKENSYVLKNNRSINEVHTLDKSKKIQSLFSLIRKFRKNEYDIVINLHRFATSGIITALCKADEKRGFRKNPFSWFYNKKFDHNLENGIHEVDRNLSLIEDLIADPIRIPHIDIADEVYKGLLTYQSKNYYCLAPASVWETKAAPFSVWKKLIEKLSTEDCHVYLLGGPDDYEKCEKLKNEFENSQVSNLCGKLTLIESAGLMKSAKRNYVNDSAPLHLASAVNAPVSVFYCSTSPKFGFGPLSNDSQIIEVHDLACKPCGIHGHRACPKGHFKCGNDLSLG